MLKNRLTKKQTKSTEPNELYKSIQSRDWDKADKVLRDGKEELAKQKHYGLYPLIRCLLLKAPEHVILTLINKYPKAAMAKDKYGNLPLHISIRNRYSAKVIVGLVIVFKRALAKRDEDGFIPLHLSIEYKTDINVILFLIATKPSSTALKSLDGDLAVHLATRCNAPSRVIISLLLSFPKSLQVRDSNGLLPEENVLGRHLMNPTSVYALTKPVSYWDIWSCDLTDAFKMHIIVDKVKDDIEYKLKKNAWAAGTNPARDRSSDPDLSLEMMAPNIEKAVKKTGNVEARLEDIESAFGANANKIFRVLTTVSTRLNTVADDVEDRVEHKFLAMKTDLAGFKNDMESRMNALELKLTECAIIASSVDSV